jgi:hypothetical protein
MPSKKRWMISPSPTSARPATRRGSRVAAQRAGDHHDALQVERQEIAAVLRPLALEGELGHFHIGQGLPATRAACAGRRCPGMVSMSKTRTGSWAGILESRRWQYGDSIIPPMSDEEKDEDSRQGIQSIEVGVPLLRVLADHGAPMMLRDLAKAAGMPAAKAHRYLVSFVRTGLVIQDANQSGRYDLGHFALDLGLASLARLDPCAPPPRCWMRWPRKSAKPWPSRSGATWGRPSCAGSNRGGRSRSTCAPARSCRCCIRRSACACRVFRFASAPAPGGGRIAHQRARRRRAGPHHAQRSRRTERRGTQAHGMSRTVAG